MEPRTVVERYVTELLNGGNPAAADDLVSNDEFGQRLARFREAFPDLEADARIVLAEGDLVAMHLVGRGTHVGLFQGVPPTGRRWSAQCTAIYRVTDGRIAEAWVNWDLLAILETLGGVRRTEQASA